MRLKTDTQSWGDFTPGHPADQAAERAPAQRSALLLTTESGNKGWLMEME